jgi:hypothetical protein
MQTRFLFDSGPVPGSENDTDPDSAYHFNPNADPNFLDADPDPDFYLMSSVSGSGSRFPK